MSLSERYTVVQERVAEAARSAGRPVEDVTLIAVSKRQSDALVLELAALGHHDFGENVIQSWRGRLELPELADVRWHLIGPVQTNKVKFIARRPPACLHTVDRASLIEALGGRLSSDAPLDVLLQVNVDREPQKAGCLPEHLSELADQICETPGVQLRGLMAIPKPLESDPPRTAFSTLRELSESIADRTPGAPLLSMGMSGDFEAAIAEGSTHVRVGTALFGVRRS
jgi:PLP dependent protein